MARQKGQAIVLIATMLAVLVGMVGPAVDGSRRYALPRGLEAAVSAAAVAACDKFQATGSYVSAEQAASTIFGTKLRLYGSPSCSPGYGPPSTGPIACSFSDGTVLTQTAYALGAQGTQFTMTATRSLELQFARILTNAASPQLGATSAGGVNNRLDTPTIAALSQSGCGRTAVNVNGIGTLSLSGELVSNGTISVTNSVRVRGDVYSRCQSSVSNLTNACFPSGASTPCTNPDVAGAGGSSLRVVYTKYEST